jgi:hypothetical protein
VVPFAQSLPIRPPIAEPEEASVSVLVPEPEPVLAPAREWVPERGLASAPELVLVPALASVPWPAPRSQQAWEPELPLCHT